MEPSQQEIAQIALQFLARVQLTGQEVPAFNGVTAWLENVSAPPVNAE